MIIWKKWLHVALIFVLTLSMLAPAAVHAEEVTVTNDEQTINEVGATTADSAGVDISSRTVSGDIIPTTFSQGATDGINVSVRVESYDKTILEEQELNLTAYDISHAVGSGIPSTGEPLVIHAIVKALEEAGHDVTDSDKFDFGGGSYISKLFGMMAGSLTGSDGWMYAVNNTPPDYGVGEYVLQDGDEIVLYYIVDFTLHAYSYFELVEAQEDTYTLQLFGAGYDVNTWEYVANPVSDATIVINGVESEYKTDENGHVTLQMTEAGKYDITAVKKQGEYSVITRPYFAIEVEEKTPVVQEDITVSVRVEGYNETLLPKTDVQLSAFDLTNIVSDAQLAEVYKTNATPLALHAIVKAFQDAGYDVTNKERFNFGDGSYFTNLAGLKQGAVTTRDGWSYAVNNIPGAVGVNAYELKAGDEIVVYFGTDWQVDQYSYLTLKSAQNKQYTVQLSAIEYDENWAPIVKPFSEATIVIDGVASTYKTDANGLATIEFTEEGTYELTAVKQSGEYSIISRPYLTIDVTSDMVVTPQPAPVEPEPAPVEPEPAPVEPEPTPVEPTEPATPTVPPSAVTPIVEQTTKYLVNKIPTATFGSEWVILATARSNVEVPQSYYNNYLASVAETLKASNGVLEGPRTEHSRLILALSAIGVDATNVGGYNVFAPLHDFEKVTLQGINGAIFALLAFDAQNYNPAVAQLNRVASLTDVAATTNTTREKLVDYIIEKELANGGFALSGTKADPDVTAMALQALAPYKADADVQPVINRALDQLSKIQLSNAGYISAGAENVQSAAQVLIALSALNIDAATDSRFIKSGKTILDNIGSFAIGDGGYKHPKNGGYNLMATQQATQAFIAYDRFLKGLPGLYEMADVTVEETPIPTPTTPGIGGGGAVTPAPVPTEQVAYIAITNKSYGDILAETEVKLNKGDTVYSVLKRATDAKGITLNTRSSSYGKYVVGIDGIKEFDRGPLSGWMYRANGDFPSYSSDSHKVNAGDYIEWVYTEDLGKDVGGYVPGVETQTPTPTTPGATTAGGGGGAQKPVETPGTTPTPTTPATEKLAATITAEQATQNKPVVVEDTNGGKVEIPAAMLNNLQLKDNETLNVAVTQQDEQIQVTIEKAVDGKTSPVAAGKPYVKVTLPASATANTVVLQLVDGEYRAVPHRVVDGKIELKVKSSGTFIVTNEVITFNDITTSGYKDDIEFLASRHVIKGKDEETFAPNDKVTRAQFAALVSRALGLQANEASTFTDTKGKWYESDVQALLEAGITTGKTATTFDPGANMTREQGAVFMARILAYVGYDAPATKAVTFTDDATINDAYKAQIALLVELGIMSGKEDGSFDAKGNLTRGQLAKMLTRTLKIAELM